MLRERGRDSWALAALVAVLMIAAQIASKAVRDGLFLEHFPVSALPLVTVVAAAVSFGAALVVGNFLSSSTPARAVPLLFAASAALFFVEALLVVQSPRYVAVAVYLHTAAFGGAVVSGFWSVVNERFDPYTAKSVVTRITAGATLGGLLGGVATWALSGASPRLLLAGIGVISSCCAAGLLPFAHGDAPLGKHLESLQGRRPSSKPPQRSSAPHGSLSSRGSLGLLPGAAVLRHYGYPRAIALVVFLVALATGLIDFVFKDGVVDDSSGSLVGFFALFYTLVGLATFGVQVLASRSVIKRLGVVQSVGLWPLLAASLIVLSLFVPSLAMLATLRGGMLVLENSLYRSGYELLYTPLPAEQKRSAKVLIDLGIDRMGTAAASGIALLVLALVHFRVERALLAVGLVASMAAFLVLVRLRRHYVESLADNLRRAAGSLSPAPEPLAADFGVTFVDRLDVWDPAPWSKHLPPPIATLPLEELRREVWARAEEKRKQARRALPPAPSPQSIVSHYLIDTPLRRRLVSGGASDTTLRQSAPALIGQLGDIALAQRETISVRMASLELLSIVPSARSAAALVVALRDPEFRVRRGAALALLHSCRSVPSLRPRRRELAQLAARELRRPARPLAPRSEFEETSPFMLDARGNEIAPSLELALLLLAIAADVEELRLALLAITSHDKKNRGTGLEYLDNLLPDGLRQRVLSLAERPELTRAQRPVSPEVLRELARRFRSRELDLPELRRAFRRARREDYERSSSRPVDASSHWN